MKNLMIMCCAAVVACSAMGESVATNGYTWTYSVADGKATIWVVRPSPTGVLEIPATLAGNPVEAIGDSLFQECNGLTSVMIQPCITSIGEMAFADCVNLSHVTLSGNIATLTIGAHAFDNGTAVGTVPRQGYSISWTNATGEVVADPFHDTASVTVSPCWTRVEPWDFSEGLAAHYTLDGNANDISGNGNNGVLHDVTTTADRHGNADGAYHFNGTSAYIEVQDSDSLRDVGQMVTISAWVKPEGWYDNWVSIMCKGYNDACRQYGPQINKAGNWLLNYYNGTKRNELVASKYVEIGKWVHVSVTYTPTMISAYLNGALVGYMTPLGNMVENQEPLYIGFDAPGGDEYLNGDMDEVRIYNRNLSAMEIRALANNDNPVASQFGENAWVYRYNIAGGVGIVQTGIGQFASTLNIPDMIDGNAVVSIGRYGFADNGDIETVNLPASVKEVGDSAFAGCSNLVHVILPNNVGTLTVGGNAFDAATEVTIGDKVGYVFVGWTNAVGAAVTDPFHRTEVTTVTPVWKKIETATIDGRTWTYSVSDNGLAIIGNGSDVAVVPAPMGDIVIPDEFGGYPVVGIGGYAFAGCEEITSLTIPSNVTSVGVGAFEGCTGLTNLIIESEALSCIAPGLMQAKFDTRFDTTSALDDANNAANVSGVIAAYTFANESPWEISDPLTGNVYAWNEANTTFAYFGQMYLEAGKTYVFGTYFDDDAYVNVDNKTLVNAWNVDATPVPPQSSVSGYKASKSNGMFSGSYICHSSGWYDIDIRLGDCTGGKGSWGKVWSSDFGAGYRDDGSTNVTQSGWSRLLDSGDGSFFRCSAMRTVFAGCSNLVSVTMPWSLVTRMSSIFPDSYYKIESLTLTGGTAAIPEKAFAGCASLCSLEIPYSVTRIDGLAFQDCRQLTCIVVPNSVTNIGNGVFSGCSGLQSLVLPFIGSKRGNSLLEDALFGHIFGESAVDGMYAVLQCYAKNKTVTRYIPMFLTDVEILDETIIAKGAFDNCSSITNLKLNVGISNIGDYAFAHCQGIRQLLIPHGVMGIGYWTFEDCGGLTNIVIPATFTSIGEVAFYGCTNLVDVTIPNSISELYVGKSAFYDDTSVNVAECDGYAFCGWTNAVGAIIADPFHSGSANTVSPWWKKTVTVAFDANGGTGTMAEQMVLDGDNLVLAENGFARDGYLFLGWAESVNGAVVFADEGTISGIEAAADGTVLYAVWKPCVPNLIPSENATFPNASQTVTISCPAADATILYTTDGSDPAVNGNVYRAPFSVYESCTVRVIARKDGLVDSDEASVTLTRAEGLSEAANLYGYLMETDETHPWTIVSDVSHDGVSCVKSGAIGNGGMTWLQTSLKKAGMVSFWWKATCEEPDVEDGEDGYYDYGAFMVDGNVVARLAGNDTGWQFFSTNITSGGKHVLRWEYSKDGATTYAPDCVWLDQVQWIPADGSGYTLTTPEPVPYAWLLGYGLGGGSDFETAAKGATGKRGGDGRALQVWQDYVTGTDPTNAASVFTAGIEFVDGVPQITWSPNLNSNGIVRSYTIWGKENLTDAAWHSPTNAADRFFKVSVEMP